MSDALPPIANMHTCVREFSREMQMAHWHGTLDAETVIELDTRTAAMIAHLTRLREVLAGSPKPPGSSEPLPFGVINLQQVRDARRR